MPGNIVKSAKLLDVWNHFHTQTHVYPTRANPVTVAAGAAAWNDFSNIVEIIPVSTIVLPFHLEWAVINAISATGNYEVKIFSGAALSEVEIAHISFGRTANQSNEGNHTLRGLHMPANERISAAVSSSNAVANTIDLKLEYHHSDKVNP